MNKKEVAIAMAYPGYAFLKGDDLNMYYKYVSKLLGYSVYTHELPYLAEKIHELSKPDFIELCRNITD